jgi:hypothetical protein
LTAAAAAEQQQHAWQDALLHVLSSVQRLLCKYFVYKDPHTARFGHMQLHFFTSIGHNPQQ